MFYVHSHYIMYIKINSVSSIMIEIWEHSRNVENTRLRLVFSVFPSFL